MNDTRATSDENGIYPDGVDKWQEIACGVYHTVGVSPTGALHSWGCNESGELGHGDDDYSNYCTKPELIDKSLFGKKAQHVACGNDHTVVLTTEGEVYTW